MTERLHDLAAPTPARPDSWRVDCARGSNPRRILKGRTTIAYATTEADAHRIARVGNVNAILLATLEIVRDVIAHHAPDFAARARILAMLDSAIQLGRGGKP